MKLKKTMATLLSSLMLIGVISSINASAETDSFEEIIPFLLGDVNLDGSITATDVLRIRSFLYGTFLPTAKQFTAMDYNQDMVIDEYDADKLFSDYTHNTISYNYYNSYYTLPNNSTRTYYKHACDTGTSSTYSSYIIPALSNNLSSIPFNEDELRTIGSPDNENTNCVEITLTDYSNNEYMGSGFIIADNIIATAAHCVYGNGFMKSAKIKVYNPNCSDLYAEITGLELHIPANYTSVSSEYKSLYDYALIYFDPNDVEYYDDDYDISDDIVDIGVMTNEFMYTDSYITISGFTGDNTHGWRRYYSMGNIEISSPYPDYRFQSSAYNYYGQSGGMAYYKPYSTFKSTVGIVTHLYWDNDSITRSLGVKFNTTVLRFYFQNNNIS